MFVVCNKKQLFSILDVLCQMQKFLCSKTIDSSRIIVDQYLYDFKSIFSYLSEAFLTRFPIHYFGKFLLKLSDLKIN